MYAKYSDLVKIDSRNPINKLKYKWKQHHHVRLDKEFKLDCKIWLQFLDENFRSVVNHPMCDVSVVDQSVEIRFFSDASARWDLGFGAILKTSWIQGNWPQGFLQQENSEKPSIEFLELFVWFH